ncbi:2-alkenal reductase (NADP(+)-dependent) [Arachis duranensis]|uniref:2-alkenal reductase (NADP(+)-dependent) n=1 Tax=Arachis duranensis TaxID=130453 RepID=A0A6P4D615_ARADU|nr:2-alkenal reductase (NADP(+)-dependent) [Arachis duranensis]
MSEEAVVMENKQVIFKGYIDGVPHETDMELKVSKIDLSKIQGSGSGSGSILVKNLYLSCDPYMRGRMRDFRESYIPPFVPGQALEGFGVCKVIHSDNPNFKPGDYISGFTGWEEYSLIQKTEQLRKVQSDDHIPLSFHVGLLGIVTLYAILELYEVCTPQKGEYVFVSAASGAVGQLVGQLAKLHGCYVVGSAGSKEKVDLLKNKLGFDKAFNYKEESDLNAALQRYFPQGIDIYFDNVGGEMLDAALLNMRIHGRIAVCGMVSQQSLSKPKGIYNLMNLIIKRIKMEGFLQSDFLHLYPRFLEEVSRYYKEGKIVYIEDMNEGLESAPSAFVGLFLGKNVGKQVIRVAHE